MKIMRIWIFCICLLALTGCAGQEGQDGQDGKNGRKWYTGFLETRLQKNLAADEDASYMEYRRLQEEDSLDEEGYYKGLAEYEEVLGDEAGILDVEEAPVPEKQVRVTMARNAYLRVEYFYDEAKTQKIEADYCYLDPGESIYASEVVCQNPYSEDYVFSEFRIYEYDSNGNGRKDLDMSSSANRVVTIPEDFTGKELSVEPVGKYLIRETCLEAYVLDKDGNHRASTGGVWKVNDEECLEEKVILYPGDTYQVEYHYNPEEYYVAGSQPSYYSDTDGVVRFRQTTAMDVSDSYLVELHPYLTIVLEGDPDGLKEIKVSKNNKAVDEIPKDHKIGNLRAGDKITVTTAEGYRLYCSQIPLDKPENPGEQTYRYYLTVPEIREEIRLRVSKSVFKVELDKSLGSDVLTDGILFDIEGSDFAKSGLYYDKNKKKNFSDAHEIFNEAIGGEESVEILARAGSLPEGYALRYDIIRTNERETKEIAYSCSLPDTRSIRVYEDGSAIDFNKIYKSINVRISLVQIEYYQPAKIENAAIELRFTDIGSESVLKEGEAADDSRKVEVAIIPKSGYYVSGKKVIEGIYRENMTYEKYRSNIAETLKTHPVKKYVEVTLDAADDYGSCIFRVDGKEAGGKVSLREDQKLTLEYTLTNEEYQLERDTEGFWNSVKGAVLDLFSKNKASVTIEITGDLDGTVISRENYIQIQKK